MLLRLVESLQLFSVCTNNANPQLLDLSSDLLPLWLTVGGPGTNAQSYAPLSIQQHNGHNRTLNYSLCKINMFLAAQTGSEEGRQAKWGKCQREEEEEEVAVAVAVEGSYLHLNPNPYWIQGTLFHGCPLEAWRPACCDRTTLTAVAAQSSLFLSFFLDIFHQQFGWFRRNLDANLISLYFL